MNNVDYPLTYIIMDSHDIEVSALDNNRIKIELINEKDKIVLQEEISLTGWENLVDFAKQILICDKTLQTTLAIKDDTHD